MQEKITPPPLVNATCVECGAQVPPAFDSCDAFMLSLSIDSRFRSGQRPNRLAIDAFALQHPKRACKSAKSYAGHLAGLCCGIDYAGSETVHHAVQQWASTSAERVGLVRPQEPELRGQLTVQYVSEAHDPETRNTRISEWASCVWNAYASQHNIARRWVETALKGRV